MAILSPIDAKFETDTYPELGARSFTVSHSKRDGLILSSLAILGGLLSARLFYEAQVQEFFGLIGALAAFLSLLLGILGVVTLIRSRATVHICLNGVQRICGQSNKSILYKDVVGCRLHYRSNLTSLGFSLLLRDKYDKISFGDGFNGLSIEGKSKCDTLINQLCSSVPSSVPIKGDHCKIESD